MGPGFGGPPPWEAREKLKPQKPKNIKEVPSYIGKVVGGTLYRLFYIFSLVWEAKKSLMFVMAFMALFDGIMPVVGALISANLLNVLGSLLIQGTARDMGLEQLMMTILPPLLWQFGYLFVNTLVNRVSNMVTSISGEVVTNHVKVKIMNKSKDIDIARFDMPDFYSKLENANREAGMRPVNILKSTFSLVSTIISSISFIVILTAIGWYVPLIMILVAFPSAVITFVYRKKNFMYMRRHSKERRQMSYYSDVLVNKDMVKEIRLFGLHKTFVNRYNSVFKEYFKGVKSLVVREGVWSICVSLVSTVVNCGLFLYIAFSVYRGFGQVGDYSLYTGSLNSISTCVVTLINVTSQIYEGSLFIENLISFMKERKSIVPCVENPITPKRHTGHTIELRNVSFRYPGTERDVIKNISLTIEPGDTLVMVGLNGAGKTTLIKLLTRLYDPTGGQILLDGHDIREYDVAELYKIYGIIFQDFGKYAVSVKENVAFGQIEKGIVMEDVKDAVERSNAKEFVSKLPNDYDTPLMRYFEDNGIELSIGQWQKLSIARAFYSDSDILILDEPTASLDAIAEQEIFNQFDRLREDKTTIFVSHRLSSATVANKIIVLKEGELVECGNHAELMAKKGHYYNLFSTQAKRYISTADEVINTDTFGSNKELVFDRPADFDPSKMPRPPFGKDGQPPKPPKFNGKPPRPPMPENH